MNSHRFLGRDEDSSLPTPRAGPRGGLRDAGSRPVQTKAIASDRIAAARRRGDYFASLPVAQSRVTTRPI